MSPASAADIPPATLAQLAAYRALVGAIYPGKTVRALAIYTATLACLEPDPVALDTALAAMAG
jgi:ATP-dependent helicase/nuclease subunit A